MKRPGYREAIDWLANNDDCHWLAFRDAGLSVSAALVRDLFDVVEARLIADLRRALAKVSPNHEAIRRNPA